MKKKKDWVVWVKRPGQRKFQIDTRPGSSEAWTGTKAQAAMNVRLIELMAGWKAVALPAGQRPKLVQ